jgi:DNA repair protein RadC
VLHNAAGIICFHNHPSGDTVPSKEDIEATERLIAAGEIIGIIVMDHIIVGDDEYTSLRDIGVM